MPTEAENLSISGLIYQKKEIRGVYPEHRYKPLEEWRGDKTRTRELCGGSLTAARKPTTYNGMGAL